MPYVIDPSLTLAHLEQAERHVREGEWRLEAQRKLVANLESRGCRTDQAKILLGHFEIALSAQIESRARLRKQAEGIV